MKKNILRITFCLIIILSTILITFTNAASIIGELQTGMNQNTSVTQTVRGTGNVIIGTIKVVGTGIAIIMLLYIAIKYIISSPEEKADWKKTAVSYTIGAFILFAAPRLVEIVMNIAQNLSGKLK